jgi:hypothetical protein
VNGGIRGRLRLVFRTARAGSGPGAGPSDQPSPSPWVQFVAFTEERRISGLIQLDSDRLSDTLNGHLEYQLCDVLVEHLAEGRCEHADEVVIDRDDLLAVLTDGPRGDPGRRVRTLAHDVTVKAGPYLIRGSLHTPPGIDPLASARRRRPMIPLSDAWVEVRSGGASMGSVVGTVVVNRATADWIQVGFAPAGALAGLEPVAAVAPATEAPIRR